MAALHRTVMIVQSQRRNTKKCITKLCFIIVLFYHDWNIFPIYVSSTHMLHNAANLRAPIWPAYHVGDEKWNFNENPDKGTCQM